MSSNIHCLIKYPPESSFILIYFHKSSSAGDEANAADGGGEQGVRRVDLLQRQRQRARDGFLRIAKVGGREAEHLDPGSDVELVAVQAEAEPPELPLPPLQEEGGPNLLTSTKEVEGSPVGIPKRDIFGDLTSTYVT